VTTFAPVPFHGAAGAAYSHGPLHTFRLPAAEAAAIGAPAARETSFGSLSYLGLDGHSALKAAVRTATERYGTQFDSPQSAVSCGLYVRLESLLRVLYGRPVIATASSAMAHLAALPTLISPSDTVVLDAWVPASVKLAAQLLAAEGVKIYAVRHNDLSALEERLRIDREVGRRTWYVGCGVYSSCGDVAPLGSLRELLSRYDGLRLYLDEGHGMSWTGPRGAGYVEEHLGAHARVVLAVALDKAFAASGAALLLPDDALEKQIRARSADLLCSGPLQPPMMGAAVASAELHLAGDVAQPQRRLEDLIAHCAQRLDTAHLPVLCPNDTPIFFVPVTNGRKGSATVERLGKRGFTTAPVGASSPLASKGVRFTLNAGHTPDDVDAFVDALAETVA
jgi:7-keto-8-aminopelargonate synthetase-like enzyme